MKQNTKRELKANMREFLLELLEENQELIEQFLPNARIAMTKDGVCINCTVGGEVATIAIDAIVKENYDFVGMAEEFTQKEQERVEKERKKREKESA